jgi:ABC-type transporter Mla MlaB component
MEELLELRQLLEQGNIPEALLLVDELEEMSLSDKINKIDSYGVILLIHLIKQQAEKRSTRSWEISLENAVREINKINQRRKSGGYYVNSTELRDILQQGYLIALKRASLEAFEGRYEAEELAAMLNETEILTQALQLIQKTSA